MPRYIDADALLADLDRFAEEKQWRKKRTLRERWWKRCGIDIFRSGIKAFPTADVVAVVRCRDCKYYDSYYTNCDHQRHDHQEFLVVQEPDDYCSYAERRTE